jgi:thioredoxin 1
VFAEEIEFVQSSTISKGYMKPAALFPVIVVLLLIGAAVAYNQLATREANAPKAMDDGVEQMAKYQVNLDDSEDTSADTAGETSEVAFETNTYVDYSPTAQAAAQQQGTSVLFFAATAWCQTCSALEAEILEKSAQIPANVTILKVDYDNDSAMKKKYGVTAQHTLIVLDESGTEVKRWVGGDFARMLRGIEGV